VDEIEVPIAGTGRRLLDAAIAEFSRHGYAEATTRNICRRAKVNLAAVSYHYGGKLGLYEAVLKQAAAKPYREWMCEFGAGAAPKRSLHRFIRQYMDSLANRSSCPYRQILIKEIVTPSEARHVIKLAARSQANILCSIISRITGSNAASQRTRLAAYSVLTQIIYFSKTDAIEKLLCGPSRNSATSLDILVKHIESFSINALTNDDPLNAGDRR
jgi:TetR/AcrR family transcriptional regulator, regulator of cefoperazone and chloramphenicol sensitivity